MLRCIETRGNTEGVTRSCYNAFMSQKYTCIQYKILLWLNWCDFQTYPYYLQPWVFLAFTWVLSNWKTEQWSQALCLKFFAPPLFWGFFISFQNKTQISQCITLSSLSIYVVFVNPHQANKDVMPFSLPTTKAYVEFIGREKARTYLQCVYYKVKQLIQRELSHTIKPRCACVWIYGGYMVANPNSTLLLENISLF
jgi:hypothetical protein